MEEGGSDGAKASPDRGREEGEEDEGEEEEDGEEKENADGDGDGDDSDAIEMFGGDSDVNAENKDSGAGAEAEKKGSDDGSGDSDVIEMFGGSDDENSGGEGADPTKLTASPSTAPPARKRRKTGWDSLDRTTRVKLSERSGSEEDLTTDRGTTREAGVEEGGDDPEKARLLSLAKSKLSKWAARLFDPDRPRGLVEAPQTIPLNDEFLEAFGKREKDFDERTGRQTQIDREDLDTAAEDGDGMEDDAKGKSREEDKEEGGCKVKVTNLAYSTPCSAVLAAFEKYGPVVKCNLIMDTSRKGSGMSIGRAYVTYESDEYADLCVRSVHDKVRLDGRMLRAALAEAKPHKAEGEDGSSKPKRSASGSGGGPARYWEKDISTKCFRCGGVGHMADRCPNPEKVKPCPLCGDASGAHTDWTCPRRVVCFHCGVPGHERRDCPEWKARRPPVKRQVCGNCFQSGHHRWRCTTHSMAILTGSPHAFGTTAAKCMQCGLCGHFSCEPLKWFFGLKGNYCFNCGGEGHHGLECRRPNVDQLLRDKELVGREIEEATARSLEEELMRQRERSLNGSDRGRRRSVDDNGGGGRGGDAGRNRNARSQPPPEKRRSSSDSGGRRRNSDGGGNRGGGGGHGHRRRHSDDRGQGSRGYQQGGGGGGGGGRRRSRSGGGGAQSRGHSY